MGDRAPSSAVICYKDSLRGDSEYRKLLLEGEGVGGDLQQLLVVKRDFHWMHFCPQKKRNSDSSPFCVSHLGLTIWRSYFISSSVCLFFCNADVIDEWLFLFGDPYMIDRKQLVLRLTCWKGKVIIFWLLKCLKQGKVILSWHDRWQKHLKPHLLKHWASL